MLALTALLLHVAGPVQAASLPEVALVGLHVTGTDAQQAHRELEALATALEQTGRVQVVRPEEVARRIDGREGIIMSEAFLGPARDLLEEGPVLYERADPDQAIPVLEEAVAEFNDTMAYTTENRSLIESLLTLGFAYMVVGEEERARSAFSRVAQLDPGRELDPVNYAPRIVDFYSQVRGEVLQRGSGSLEVLSPQPGAEVFIGGASQGKTPLQIVGLAAGPPHAAVIRATGHTPLVSLFTVQRDGLRALSHRLSSTEVDGADKRDLQIRSIPDGATVHLEGKRIGSTPLFQRLSVGDRKRVVVSKAGYEAFSTWVAAGPAAVSVTAELVALPPQYGYLSLSSAPSKATVYIGNNEVGKTPLSKYKLPTGKHTVVLDTPKHRGSLLLDVGPDEFLVKKVSWNAAGSLVVH